MILLFGSNSNLPHQPAWLSANYPGLVHVIAEGLRSHSSQSGEVVCGEAWGEHLGIEITNI